MAPMAGRPDRREPARVAIHAPPESYVASDGAVTTRQSADVTLPRSELERIWTPEYLERLARTYWRFLERVSLGLLRVLYSPTAREVVLVRRPLVLLRFSAPEYEIAADRGTVTWRIDRGLLVIPRGRRRGFLRITVNRTAAPDPVQPSEEAVRVTSEVASFYPMIAGAGRFSRIGRVLYRVTQLRLHVIVTNAFLRSLARLDLVPSVVGMLSGGAPPAAAQPAAVELPPGAATPPARR